MNSVKLILQLIVVVFLFASCTSNNLVDTNEEVAENNWTYAKAAKATLEIKDINKSYNFYFKLRHTSAYRYSNIYVMVRIKGNGFNKSTRYEFKLATSTGEWLGKGSGDIYTNNFSLLNDYRFAKAGKYNIEIEQNMRDNPLIGISDVGITISKNP
jgi:gliding motility-associated lipoprotein GldH